MAYQGNFQEIKYNFKEIQGNFREKSKKFESSFVETLTQSDSRSKDNDDFKRRKNMFRLQNVKITNNQTDKRWQQVMKTADLR